MIGSIQVRIINPILIIPTAGFLDIENMVAHMCLAIFGSAADSTAVTEESMDAGVYIFPLLAIFRSAIVSDIAIPEAANFRFNGFENNLIWLLLAG